MAVTASLTRPVDMPDVLSWPTYLPTLPFSRSAFGKLQDQIISDSSRSSECGIHPWNQSSSYLLTPETDCHAADEQDNLSEHGHGTSIADMLPRASAKKEGGQAESSVSSEKIWEYMGMFRMRCFLAWR